MYSLAALGQRYKECSVTALHTQGHRCREEMQTSAVVALTSISERGMRFTKRLSVQWGWVSIQDIHCQCPPLM